jgi:hypothetical protein
MTEARRNCRTIRGVAAQASPKADNFQNTVNANRSRATAEVKSCRPGAFDSLLKALNLSPGCES